MSTLTNGAVCVTTEKSLFSRKQNTTQKKVLNTCILIFPNGNVFRNGKEVFLHYKQNCLDRRYVGDRTHESKSIVSADVQGTHLICLKDFS